MAPAKIRNAGKAVRDAKRSRDVAPSRGALRPVKNGRVQKKPDEEKENRSAPKNAPKQPSLMKPQQDKDGHIIVEEGLIIGSDEGSRYQLVNQLGKGMYGTVVHAIDTSDNKNYAVKIIRNDKDYRRFAKMEIRMLVRIHNLDKEDKHLIVRVHDIFKYHGHMCMLFPKLGVSVYEFMRDNKMSPFPLDHVRSIGFQLSHSVEFLHKHGIVHCDLKPENIMFTNAAYDVIEEADGTEKRVLRDTSIRLIDLGNAIYDHDEHHEVITTRHYRAPEVVLKLGWSKPADVWSIGAILFELYNGHLLFPGDDDRDHLGTMEHVLGEFPEDMCANKKTDFFADGRVQLSEEEAEYVRVKFKPLNEYMKSGEPEHVELFKLLKQMLGYDDFRRIKLYGAMHSSLFFKRLPKDQRDALLPVR